MKKFVKIILVLTLICFTACNKQQKEETLQTIENLVEEKPDSALVLISAFKNKLLSREQKAKLILYQTIAKDKSGMDISNDDEIFNAAEIILKKGTDLEKAKVLLYAGRVHQENSDNENALIYAIDAKKYGLKTDDNTLKGLILSDIGSLYYEGLNNDSAISSFKQAFCFLKKTDKYQNTIIVLMMIGNCYLVLDKQDSAIYYFNKALKNSEEINDIYLQSNILINIGSLYNNYCDYSNSLQMLKKALLISDNQENSLYIYLNMSKSYHSLSYMDSATYCIRKCFDFLYNGNSQYAPETYISAYGIYSKIEEKKGNIENAIKIKNEYVNMLDSIYTEISKQKLIEIQEKYEHSKLENENQILRLQKKNISLILFSITISLIIIILGVNRKRIKTEKELLRVVLDYKTLEKMQEKMKEEMAKKKLESSNEESGKQKINSEMNSTEDEKAESERIKGENEKSSLQMGKDKISDLNSFNNQLNIRIILLNYFKIDTKIKKIKNDNIFDSNLSKEEIIKRTKSILNQDEKSVYENMIRIIPNIISEVRNINENLKETEICICILHYAGFGNHEISAYLGLKQNVVHTKNSKIRNKLNIEERGSIADYFEEKFAKKFNSFVF